MVYGVCLRITGSAADAEDATQECLLELARKAGDIRGSLGGWLHTVAARRSLMIPPRTAADAPAVSNSTPWAKTLPDPAVAMQVSEAVDAALDQLDPDDKDLLIRPIPPRTHATTDRRGARRRPVNHLAAPCQGHRRRPRPSVGDGRCLCCSSGSGRTRLGRERQSPSGRHRLGGKTRRGRCRLVRPVCETCRDTCGLSCPGRGHSGRTWPLALPNSSSQREGA